ncbi:MAG: aminomethyltransferase [Desulfomicrobiaceae bacterium]|jgi:aminomethyltransferase|nr:aminomethyltransferase [Desulfomicrobiaceae bacterium]
MADLHTSPLTSWHHAHGARMAPFAGWDMPIQYTSILEEHQHTRTQASIFDICHMGEFFLSGPGATDALARIVTHNLETLKPGRCRYGFMLNDNGGVLDDLIVYRLAADDYMLVVNAATTASDLAWIREHLPRGLTLEDRSSLTAKIDLQGPQSFAVLAQIIPGTWTDLAYFAFRPVTWRGMELLVSRTGYTGELGVELYVPWNRALELWEALLEHPLVKPAGLGARDTLRLEMGLPLYGQDLDTAHTPVEAGYGALLTSPAEFIGKSALPLVRERLVGLALEGRRSARHGDGVLLGDRVVGRVTSGSFAPSLGHAIALAYVTAEAADADAFTIQAAKTLLSARKVELPFYTQGTARTKLA